VKISRAANRQNRRSAKHFLRDRAAGKNEPLAFLVTMRIDARRLKQLLPPLLSPPPRGSEQPI